MYLSCMNHEFSEKWDKKLNKLLSSGRVVSISQYTIDIKIKSGTATKKKYFFFEGEVDTYDTYRVWVDNKHCAYGRVYEFNDEIVPDYMMKAPSKTTMERLFKLEESLRYSNMKGLCE